MRAVEHALDVHPGDQLVPGEAELGERAHREEPGVVEQPVERAPMGSGKSREDHSDRFCVGHVHHLITVAVTQLGSQRFQ